MFGAPFGVKEMGYPHIQVKDATAGPPGSGTAVITFEFEVATKLTNSFKTLHGGAAATIVDNFSSLSLMAFEAWSAYQAGSDNASVSMTTSAHLSVEYVAAGKMGSKICIACSIDRSGRRLAFLGAEMYQEGAGKNGHNMLITKARHMKNVLDTQLQIPAKAVLRYVEKSAKRAATSKL